MGRVVNYSKLSKRAKHKLKGAGYKADKGGRTASRKSKKRRGGKIAKAQDKAKKKMAEYKGAIKARGKVAYDKALVKEKARKQKKKARATGAKGVSGSTQRGIKPGTLGPTKENLAKWKKKQKVGKRIGPGDHFKTGSGSPGKPGWQQNLSKVKEGYGKAFSTLNAAFNPWSKRDVEVGSGVTGTLPRAALSTLANKPFTTALALTGVAGMARGLTAGVARMMGKTAVQQASKVGTKGLVQLTLKGKTASTAATFATNSKNTKVTTSWLTKLAKATSNPTLVVSTLMASIGTYPFAGFIKEEALQTLGFGIRTAQDNNDIEGTQSAIDFQKEILDPDLWDQIKAKIPFVNILANLDDFYEAAKLKVSIDEKKIADMKHQLETGETDDAKWARIRQEQADEEQQNIDYYNTERMKLVNWENEAYAAARAATRESDIAARNEDARFWAKERAKQREREAEDREAQAKFWMAYRRAMQKQNEDSRPSKLNFGLL